MRRMGIGLGIGINRSNYAQGIFNAYQSRVTADGGVTEAGGCVDAVSGLLQTASLLLIPSGYKSGKAYAEIPTNGNGDLTWTRASDAWRTNADGLIQRVPWNLLTQSEGFNTASWSPTSASITANSTTAPNGTLTADTLVEDTSNGVHLVAQTLGSVTGIYTLSFYAKPKGRNWIFVSMVSAANYGAYFDIENGVTGTVQSSITSATITSVGDGWYRCTMTSNPSGGALRCQIYTATANLTNSYTGNGTSGVYLWGAQVVEGSSAQTYFPTTDRLNVPRLSYMYGSCPALLLEPQRTNLCLWSNTFQNVVWVTGFLTAADNNSTGIDGNQTACLVTTSATSHFIFQNITVTQNTTYTVTFYVKRGTMTDLKYRFRDGTSNTDIIAPTSYYSQTNSSTFTRISVTLTTPTGCVQLRFYPFSDSGSSGTAYITQAQCEQGAYSTTIIPTTSATATRIADSFSRNNIYTNGLITSSGGTWFFELKNNVVYTRDNTTGMFIGDGTTSNAGNQFIIRATSGGRLLIYKYVSGTGTSIYVTTTDTVKIAIKWDGTSADVFANGTKVVSSTSFTTTNMENLIGYVGIPLFIQQIALYPSPLSDTDCTTLTTL
jgi:hypothetical protein